MVSRVNVDECSNVKVVVRVRPPNKGELNGCSRNVVEVMNDNVLVFDPKDECSPRFSKTGKFKHRDIRKRCKKDLKFAFNYVFRWDASNAQVFDCVTHTVLDDLLDGYNCSVFAYGATGSGKTHTMLGSEAHPGVIYHAMNYLYDRISEMSGDRIFDISVSYLEVYNEQIRDLLLPHGSLPIREDPETGVVVFGLSCHKPTNAEDLLFMLQSGSKNRTQHPTDANAESSRSHAVLQVFVRQKDRTAGISTEVKVAKMCLVDLAGSERATVTRNRGARFREGANINRSLLALGNVINSLSDQKVKGHIPYRDSKLTRLLKDSLGGNCRTLMIAAVSPSSLSYEDTYNTLKYADRAKSIRLTAKKNILSVDFHISQYRGIVEELTKEISELKSKLSMTSALQCSSSTSSNQLECLRGSLQHLYADQRAVREKLLRQEIHICDTRWRQHCVRRVVRRAAHFTSTDTRPHLLIDSLQQKLAGLEAHRQHLCEKLNSVSGSLENMQSSALASQDKNSLQSEVLALSMKLMSLEMEFSEHQHYEQHLRKLVRSQAGGARASEMLISSLLRLVNQQHEELIQNGSVTPIAATGYSVMCESVSRWGVSWSSDTQSSTGLSEEAEHDSFDINTLLDIPLISHTGLLNAITPVLLNESTLAGNVSRKVSDSHVMAISLGNCPMSCETMSNLNPLYVDKIALGCSGVYDLQAAAVSDVASFPQTCPASGISGKQASVNLGNGCCNLMERPVVRSTSDSQDVLTASQATSTSDSQDVLTASQATSTSDSQDVLTASQATSTSDSQDVLTASQATSTSDSQDVLTASQATSTSDSQDVLTASQATSTSDSQDVLTASQATSTSDSQDVLTASQATSTSDSQDVLTASQATSTSDSQDVLTASQATSQNVLFSEQPAVPFSVGDFLPDHATEPISTKEYSVVHRSSSVTTTFASETQAKCCSGQSCTCGDKMPYAPCSKSSLSTGHYVASAGETSVDETGQDIGTQPMDCGGRLGSSLPHEAVFASLHNSCRLMSPNSSPASFTNICSKHPGSVKPAGREHCTLNEISHADRHLSSLSRLMSTEGNTGSRELSASGVANDVHPPSPSVPASSSQLLHNSPRQCHVVDYGGKENMPVTNQGADRSKLTGVMSGYPQAGGPASHIIQSLSYADVVKTPSPHLVLQNVNGQCMQTNIRNQINEHGMSPKNRRGGEAFVIDPHTLNTMRRLKQLGMPSVVENFVPPTACPPTGDGDCSKVSDSTVPSYMQVTKLMRWKVQSGRQLGNTMSTVKKRDSTRRTYYSETKHNTSQSRSGWKI